MLRFVRDEFSDFRESTIGASALANPLTPSAGRKLTFSNWGSAFGGAGAAFLTQTCKVEEKTVKVRLSALSLLVGRLDMGRDY